VQRAQPATAAAVQHGLLTYTSSLRIPRLYQSLLHAACDDFGTALHSLCYLFQKYNCMPVELR
jgi:hypothetical protein